MSKCYFVTGTDTEVGKTVASCALLQAIGATHLHEGRDPRILTRSQLQRLQLAWPQQQGRYPLTYHLFLGVIARE